MKPEDAPAIASIPNSVQLQQKITLLQTSPAFSEPQPELTADQALQKLIAGNQRFINKRTTSVDHLTRLEKVAPKQTPFATILGCSDSRVPIEVIFDQGLGDLFVIRVAGNLVTSTELASIEYGASVLKTKVLLVLGHRSCGAVSAALKGGHLMGQMNVLIDSIQPAVSRSSKQPGDPLENAVRENVFLQMERMQESAVVNRLLHEKQIKLVGGYFDLNTGKVSIFKVLTSSRETIRVNRIYAF
ncbi:carbonic anhydrase [Phormidium tenue FACHB-886]|nr:carbonic anhydrase [Phormidium tenue FACHB-886]